MVNTWAIQILSFLVYEHCNNHILKRCAIIFIFNILKSLLIFRIYIFPGKGTYRWKGNGAIYDGDWSDDKRNGFGTFSVPNKTGNYQKQYSGGWKNNKRHVNMIFNLYFRIDI